MSLWFVTTMSVLYCFIFANQEIPTLTHDNNKILGLVSLALKNDSKNLDARTAMQHYLLSKKGGISNAYRFLNRSGFGSNETSLVFLLRLQNDFLMEFARDDKSMLQKQSKEYNGFDVMESFYVAFENLQVISDLDSQVCAAKILEDKDNYMVAFSIYHLHEISLDLEAKDAFEEKMRDLIKKKFLFAHEGRI
jgi:hypothetical protein